MKRLVPSLVIIIVAVFTFGGLKDTFFQQDEWLGLGSALYRRDNGGLSKVVYDIFHNPTSRFLPLTSLTNYFVFTTVKFNFGAYGVMAILLAILNTHLAYMFATKLLSSKLIGLASALFWLVNGMSFQAITWISPVVPSQLCFLFMLLGLNYFLRYLSKPSLKLVVITTFLITCSLLYKEIGVFFVFVIPLLSLLQTNRSFLRTHFFHLAIIIVVPILVAQVSPLFFLPKLSTGTFTNLAPSARIISSAFIIPARSLFQIFVPLRPFYNLVYKFNTSFYLEETNGYVIETIVGDVVSLLGSVIILFIVTLCLAISSSRYSKIIAVCLLGFVSSCLPFVIFSANATLLEPRFYIFPSFWGGLLLGAFVAGVTSKFSKHPLLVRVLTGVGVTILLAFHIVSVKKYIGADLGVASYRKSILNTIAQIKPNLSSTTIWYFYTDNNGFYEYQSGVGQMLAVWLYETGSIPDEALVDLNFWDAGYEGVKNFSSGAYGYFMTREKLKSHLDTHPEFDLTNLHAYYWDQQLHTVTNVSQAIRAELSPQPQP